MTGRTRLLRLALALLLPVFSCTARAELAGATEHEVKAAFLYKFLDFVQWPPEARVDGATTIGIVNDDAVEAALRSYVDLKRERAPKVVVKSVTGADQAGGVNMLFVGRRETHRLERIADALRGKPVLVVSDGADALERGSMINFVVSDRVRFEIALDNALQAGLHLNARLLSVAVRVKKSEGLFPQTLYAEARGPASRERRLCHAGAHARGS